ncbi:MAG TPA: haloacid dehalogenase-like hydrolase [Candidatus Thermoplasmatota archaeon]|nr:haloacid dehalogenase-like hydrolase [Candidatus Thermoplasmatota archaeon]
MTLKAVFVDMDNTLLVGRTVLAIARETGLGEERMRAELASRGREDRCRFVASLLRGWPVARVAACATGFPFDPGARAFVELLSPRLALYVVSDSFSQAVRAVSQALSIPRWIANPLEERGGACTGRVLDWRAESGVEAQSPVVHKREALLSVARTLGLRPEQFAVVGDGVPDAEAMEVAGLGVAIRPMDGVAERADLIVSDLEEAARAILKSAS